jgi:hypothetical protein
MANSNRQLLTMARYLARKRVKDYLQANGLCSLRSVFNIFGWQRRQLLDQRNSGLLEV